MESMERPGRCPWQPTIRTQLEEGQPYMPNIVYVLTNPAMPGMVKIGMTDQEDLQLRMRQLYTTGVPLPFECVIARRMEGREAAEIETALHTAFDPYRVNPSREFFEIEPEHLQGEGWLASGNPETAAHGVNGKAGSVPVAADD